LPAQEDTGGAEIEVTGAVDVSMGDNFFDFDGNRNPTFRIPAGTAATFNLTNDGSAIHNMRIAGDDGEYDTDDDSVSDPGLMPSGSSGTLQFTPAAGTYDYRCDFHPDQMVGQITAE
jgi:plastocyanin